MRVQAVEHTRLVACETDPCPGQDELLGYTGSAASLAIHLGKGAGETGVPPM